MDKHFIGFESINPDNRSELGGKSKGVAGHASEAIRTIRSHGVGVVGLFVMGFDEDTQATFQAMWDFIRSSELDSVSTTMLTPYPGTPFRDVVESENRLLDVPWSHYDTAHVTFVPKNFTVDEFRGAYDWLCRKIYSPTQIAQRGLRSMGRYPFARPAKSSSAASAPTMATGAPMPIGIYCRRGLFALTFSHKSAPPLANLSVGGGPFRKPSRLPRTKTRILPPGPLGILV